MSTLALLDGEAQIQVVDLETELGETTTKRRSGGLLWLVGAALIWGTVGVASALLNRIETTPALTVGFLRLAFSSPFLLGLAVIVTRRNPFQLKRREWLLVTLMGLTTACYQLCYFTAIPMSNVTLVVVIALCSSPIIVAVLSIPIFGERLTIRISGALLLALVGTGLLAFGGGQAGEFFKPEYLWGALLALGAGFSYSSFAILSKLTTRHSEIGAPQAMSVAFTLGALMLLPLAWFSGNLKFDLAGGVWLWALYLGIVPTGLAYLIYMRGLRTATATAATITTLLEPAVAAFLAWLLLKETLSFSSLLGAILLIGSVALLSSKRA
jgi:DME family drug/metabolite transporter